MLSTLPSSSNIKIYEIICIFQQKLNILLKISSTCNENEIVWHSALTKINLKLKTYFC